MTSKTFGRNVNGWLIVDKPLGVTSTSLVDRVKKAVGAKKAGHGGTLDPLATGLLPIALGEATKTVSFLMENLKTYEFSVGWGVSTKTDDAEGEVVDRSSNRPSKSEIINILSNFTGIINQVPPIYSAIKVNGRRAYKLARSNRPFRVPPRLVKVQTLTLLETPNEDEAVFKIKSGKGTYIRSLARDLGEALNTYGYVKRLRRTAIGPFNEDQAISLDSLEALGHSAANSEHFFGVEAVLADIPAFAFKSDDAQKIRHGQSVSMDRAVNQRGDFVPEQCPVLATMSDGKVVALARLKDGEIKPHRILNT